MQAERTRNGYVSSGGCPVAAEGGSDAYVSSQMYLDSNPLLMLTFGLNTTCSPQSALLGLGFKV